MKGNDKIIATLNDLLSQELTAVNQYFVHTEMCENWGYDRLHTTVRKRAIQEMKHAESLIARILFLDGTPIVSKLNAVHIGAQVDAQLKNDLGAEETAVRNYNTGARLALEVGDAGTKTLLESILKDEEAHVDDLETQLTQVQQMGLQNYLAQQVTTE